MNLEILITIVATLGSAGVFKLLGDWWAGKQKYKQDGYQILSEKYDQMFKERDADYEFIKNEFRVLSDKYNQLLGRFDQLKEQVQEKDKEISLLKAEIQKLKDEREMYIKREETYILKIQDYERKLNMADHLKTAEVKVEIDNPAI